jgi:hypothetical protein
MSRQLRGVDGLKKVNGIRRDDPIEDIFVVRDQEESASLRACFPHEPEDAIDAFKIERA